MDGSALLASRKLSQHRYRNVSVAPLDVVVFAFVPLSITVRPAVGPRHGPALR